MEDGGGGGAGAVLGAGGGKTVRDAEGVEGYGGGGLDTSRDLLKRPVEELEFRALEILRSVGGALDLFALEFNVP